MNAYVSAIATAAVVSDRFPLYTIWNVSKYENFSSMHFSHIRTEYGYICGVNILIKFEYGKIRNRKNSISRFLSCIFIYCSLTVEVWCYALIKAGANASNISSDIENFACWMKCWMHLRGVKFYEKWKKKKKIVLDDVGWSLNSVKLFIQHFLTHPI